MLLALLVLRPLSSDGVIIPDFLGLQFADIETGGLPSLWNYMYQFCILSVCLSIYKSSTYVSIYPPTISSVSLQAWPLLVAASIQKSNNIQKSAQWVWNKSLNNVDAWGPGSKESSKKKLSQMWIDDLPNHDLWGSWQTHTASVGNKRK